MLFAFVDSCWQLLHATTGRRQLVPYLWLPAASSYPRSDGNQLAFAYVNKTGALLLPCLPRRCTPGRSVIPSSPRAAASLLGRGLGGSA